MVRPLAWPVWVWRAWKTSLCMRQRFKFLGLRLRRLKAESPGVGSTKLVRSKVSANSVESTLFQQNLRFRVILNVMHRKKPGRAAGSLAGPLPPSVDSGDETEDSQVENTLTRTDSHLPVDKICKLSLVTMHRPGPQPGPLATARYSLADSEPDCNHDWHWSHTNRRTRTRAHAHTDTH